MRPTLSVYLAGAAVLTAGAVFVRLLRLPMPDVDGARLREALRRSIIPGPSELEMLPQRLRERGLQ
jgi:hypothetical protein